MAKKKKSKSQAAQPFELASTIPKRHPSFRHSVYYWLGLGLLFVALGFACDRGLAGALYSLYLQLNQGPENIHLALKTRVDGYIFGDSRARHHYDPAIIAAETGLQFFNAGTPGFDMMFYRCLADLIEQRYTPKFYVVNISLADLHRNTAQYPPMAVFAPFMDDSAAVRDVLIKQSWRGGIKFAGLGSAVDNELIFSSNLKLTWKYQWRTLAKFQLSHLARFNSKLHSIVEEWGQKPVSTHNGFKPLTGPFVELDDPSKIFLEEDIDLYFAHSLVQFVRQAQKKGIRVIFAIGPSYRVKTGFQLKSDEWYYLRAIRQCAQLLGVPLLEISENTRPEYRDVNNYVDTDHLNAKGVAIFTQHFALHLRRLMELPDFTHTVYQAQIAAAQYVLPIELFTGRNYAR